MLCPVCNGGGWEYFFSGIQYGFSGDLYENIDIPADKGARKITLKYCHDCYFIMQHGNDFNRPDYDSIGRKCLRKIPDYVEEIIKKTLANTKSSHPFIVEIGANDGMVMQKFQQYGYDNIIGVEPSRPAIHASPLSDKIIPDYFTKSLARQIKRQYGPADIIICRHTAEHVPADQLQDFFGGISTLLKDEGQVVLEVPDSDTIIKNLRIDEIWDEHVSYFRASSLSALLKNHNLSIMDANRFEYRAAINMVFYAAKSPQKFDFKMMDLCSDKQILNFHHAHNIYVKQFKNKLTSCPRPIICMGASHPQKNFVNFMNLANFIDGFIDDDVSKQGKYVNIGKYIPIFSSNDIFKNLKANSATILETAFGYPGWVEQLRQSWPNIEYQSVLFDKGVGE